MFYLVTLLFLRSVIYQSCSSVDLRDSSSIQGCRLQIAGGFNLMAIARRGELFQGGPSLHGYGGLSTIGGCRVNACWSKHTMTVFVLAFWICLGAFPFTLSGRLPGTRPRTHMCSTLGRTTDIGVSNDIMRPGSPPTPSHLLNQPPQL